MTPMIAWARPDNGDSLISVWVVPRSRRTEVVGPYGEALRIRVTAPPEAGRANRELVAFVEQRTGAAVDLVHGGGSRRKTLRIHGLGPGEVRRLLGPVLPG